MSWGTLIALILVANLFITIYLYPRKRPDYWWLPGAWIWFKLHDYLWPIDPEASDPNKRRKFFAPPRIA
jgi:hypothetical protein